MPGLGSTLWNGVSGLRSFSTAMTVVSDNIANAGTTGFKANEIRFADLVSSNYSTISSYTDREGSGSRALAILTDFAQGPIINTSNWSDLAINGEGFFKVQDPNNNKVYYTRDGSFHLDKDGNLVNALGMQVLDKDGNPISVGNPQDYASIVIDSTGKIVAIRNDNTQEERGQIGLFRFPDPNGLRRVGNNLWEITPLAGDEIPGNPGDTGFGTIVSFAIEGSNVDLSEELVNMIIYQANFNANSKVITTASDMLNTTVNMVR